MENPDLQQAQQAITSKPQPVTVDARGLACPLPLLRLKVALRPLVAGDQVEIYATDPHSQVDILRFCEVNQYRCVIDQPSNTQDWFTFIITKG